MGEVMMVTRRPVVLQAVRWRENGDHPDDGVGKPRKDPSGGPDYIAVEGAVVRFYRHPNRRGSDVHRRCNRNFHDHGFIDHWDGGQPVCPGDWIVTDANGHHSAVHDDQFRLDYEVVSHVSVT